ncbi:MAG: tetratricopeptide repeat protein [Telmatospirillum sp.]|nr:tetratricopeptide repeat protein [Telmatospirillum sp.]
MPLTFSQARRPAPGGDGPDGSDETLATDPAGAGADRNDGDEAGRRLRAAIASHEAGHLDAAEADYRAALAIRPDYPEVLTNLGCLLRAKGRLEEAVALQLDVAKRWPGFPAVFNNLGVAWKDLNRPAEAVGAFRPAIRLKPDYAQAHANLGGSLLLAGQFREGWSEYEWRWLGGIRNLIPRPFPSPLWTGGDLTGRRLLLHAEQGHGDAIHFSRYAALAAARGATVILEVHPGLKRLLATVPGVSDVIAGGDPLPAFDCHLPLLSAPHRFGTTLADIPADCPYVSADPALAASWGRRLPRGPGLLAGVVWAGDARRHDPVANAIDRRRSMALAAMRPLLSLPGIRFVSLQMGPAAGEIADLPAAIRPLDPMTEVGDFADTAAIIANLDLVITVDTSVAHLAGAMGKPVWILSRFDGCWRWLTERDDTPWYPTARLFRQTCPGDWTGVIARVADAFGTLTGSDNSAIPPSKGLAPASPMPADEVSRLFREAVTHHAQGAFDTAEVFYLTLLAGHLVGPGHAEAHNNLGLLHRQCGRSMAALENFHRAILLRPDYADAHNNLGLIFSDLGETALAVRCHRNSLILDPGSAQVLSNLGVALQETGQIPDAIAAYRRALVLEPALAGTHYNLGLALLLTGDLAEGWREHEWAWRGGVPEARPRHLSAPRWTGQDIAGKTLLFYGEQGLGDVLQFVRYSAGIAARGARVIIEVQPPLRRLLASVPGVSQVIAAGEPVPPADLSLPMMGAPCLFGTTLDTVPADGPYVTADPETVAAWRHRLASLSGVRVGLVWAGAPRSDDPRAHAVDRRRSIGLRHLQPLLRRAGVSFVSLQKGDAARQIVDLPLDLRPFDPMGGVVDFADTAAIIANLDLVITVDTSVAHLAGAMGTPVWILSRFDGCWRWLTDRDDSPWYPSARLFRQMVPGDWDSVIARVGEALTTAVAGKAGRTGPANGEASLPVPPLPRQVPPPRHRSPTEMERIGRLFADAIRLFEAGHMAEAAPLYRTILSLDPDHVDARHHLGLTALKEHRLEEAAKTIADALALRPDNPEATSNLGVVRLNQGRLAEARDLFRRAALIKPDYATALSNWASTLGELEQWEQATMACRQAIAVAPAFAEAYANLGVVLSETGRLTEAESSFRTALRLGPDHVEPHYNLATVLLAQGRYREGWAEYEWRRRGDDPEVAPRELPGPEWSGQPLHGKTLLLYPEQGFGDLLQFCRYASLFAARGASVILESYRGLARLLATLSGVSRVVIKGDPLPPFDYHLSVMSAPFRLGTQGDTIPSRVPYLRADPEAVAAWRDRIAALPGLKAGLVWSGDPRPHDRRAHATDRRRSLRLEQMRPILDCAGVSFVSLQKGAAAGQMEGLPEGRRPVDWMEAVTDFADTAAIVANLDLVITVDTSVAHLAGALGKPVWILSRFAGCWRWLENREDSPWYPNARIFGQPARGSWAPVVQRVADELRSLVAARPATGRTIDAPGTARPEPRPTGPFAEALAHHRAGRLEAAATGYRKVLAHDPGHFDSLHHLGLIALWSGHAAEAIQWISQALLHERSHVGAHLNLAHALLQTGQAAAALLTLRMAADLQPEDAEDLYRLGALLHDLDRPADAAAAYRQALSVRPDVAMAWTNLGGALGELEHHEAAIAACGRALAVDRGQVRACANMGASLHELGRIEEAVALYRDALAVAPDLAETRHNLGTALLSRGLYDEGWQNYEWRWKGLIAGLTPIRPERPVWNGEDLAGRTLLLRREQGLGDVLQFARFAGVLAARGARVLIEAYPPLARLLATVPGVAGVVSDGDPRPVADVELPLLSVPSRLGTTVETIPADVPYLFADEAARDIWRQRLSGLTGIKVGLVWAGDPRTHNVRNHAIDRRRSIALSRLIPLLTLSGLSIVSLQKGEAAVAEMDALPPDLRPFDPMDEVEDFADTAAIVANLDLVITVDTSVAHLAGGMGRPVWILNRFNGCWRWLDGRDDSPWYPTARLFRQTRAGDWDGVVARVVQALSELAGQAAPPPTERLFAEAVGHHAAHRLDEADTLYRRILARDPAEPVVLHHRGVIALQREAPADACAAIRQSLCLSPAYGEAWTNLATAQRDLGDRAGAEASLRRATLLLPRHAEPLNNLGSLVQEQGRLDEAIALFRRALALCPDHPEIHCNLGAALLQDGQYPEGWAEHEWRLHPGAGWSQRDAMAGPVWDGGPLAGKTLLLWSEQGLGDDIQFARFAAPIAALGARVLLEAPAPLARLFATVPGVSGGVVRGGELPPCDVHLSAMSAPYRLGVTLTDLPARIPYLRPDPDLVTHWSERLAHLPGLKVGLVWAGDPRPHDRRAAAIDRRRSMPLAALAPVLSIAGISFISLQMGDAAAQIGTLRAELRPFDPMADVGDLMDTAAIVANLDLVVTVDTAVAHLAGAMGKPVRLLSRFDGCWRWLQNRDDSPWYPTLRLIRQTVPADWDGVVARLARDLERLAAGPGPAPVAASPVDLPLARAIDLHRAGRIPEAETLYRAILTQVPDHSFALHHLGMIRQSRDGNGQGLPLLKRAVTADPTYAEALNNLGAALAEAGAPEQAADCCRRSVILRPDYAKALSNLGKSLKDLGRPRDAALCYRRALALEPGFVMGLSNLGAALQDLERLEEARDCCRRALMLEPGHPIALNNLGVTLMQAGDDEGAAIACDRAVTAAPDYAEAHVNLGMALLLRGDFARGWAEYDWRWRGGMAALPDRRLDRPRWSGEDLSGRTLLFHGEQGLGDVLHFVRFALPLAGLGARVLVEAHAPLKRLLATVPGVSGVLAFGETLPPFDFHLPMLSAPLALAAAPATWAEAVPYLKADPVLTGLWGRRLSCLSGLKVGLVWAGNPRPHDPGAHLVDRRRSLPLAALTPLLAMPGLSFVSLQLGDAAREIEALPPDLRPTDPTGDISDFADTAAIVANLDLVISVDTSVVHLTGAMGKPVWVMSRFDGCWRWLKERDDSPWYPTLRLFRQAGAGDWTDVVAAVMAALQNLRPPPRRDEAGTPAARFSEAVTHHQAGRLDAAEAIYRDLLDGEPDNIGCLYHLGVLRGQRGDATGAIALLRRAADRNGSIPGLHLALADALSSTGAIGEAIAAYRDALTLAPDLVPALYNLGNALLAGSDTGNAARCFRQAVQCRPDLPEPYNNLGNALSSTGAFDEAGRAFAHAAALRPDIAAAHNNLGNIRKEQGRETDAAACFHTALSIDPGYVEARYNLANLLLETGDADGALRHFRQVIALRPDLAEAYNNFGSLMHMAGDLDQAALCYRRCLAIAPDFTEAHANLGTVWRDQGSLDQADAAYRTAIALNPGYGLAHTNLGVTLLLRGEFEEGLAEYEWRSRKGPGGDPRRYDRPLWAGQPRAGRTLLLHCEQGLGDALHFARYVPILAGMGASVVLEAYPPLVRLFSTLPGLSGLVPAGAALPAHDFQLPLMSVAHRLGTRLDSIPGDVPYLSADPVLSRRWAARLSHLRGLKVGLVWAGDPRPHDPRASAVDRRRSVPLERLARLLPLPGASFVSLQKGQAARTLETLPQALRPFDPMAEVSDFADTAAIIANLDLVITVDTSVAHLAGAMGRPVWILSRFDGCWRWLQDRDDSPWYPTARLFRQPSPGDWDAVAGAVGAALSALLTPSPTGSGDRTPGIVFPAATDPVFK